MEKNNFKWNGDVWELSGIIYRKGILKLIIF